MKARRQLANSLLFRWRDTFCSEHGPSAVTRLVLWTVSKHMDVNGVGSFPNQELIARESGLGLRAVKRHLQAAEKSGWLQRQPRRRGERESWRYGTEYAPRFPVPNGEQGTPIEGGQALVSRDPTLVSPESTLVSEGAASPSGSPSVEAYADRKEETPAARAIKKKRAGREEFVAAYEAEERRQPALAAGLK